MHIPITPPDHVRVLMETPHEVLGKMLAWRGPAVDGEYLHWDQLRHRPPPPGLSSEQWWASIRLARESLAEALPLLDKAGNPFRFARPEHLLIHLHHIDRDAAGHINTPVEINTPEHRDRYLVHSLIEEAITSSQLEGAATTRNVAKAMLREGRAPRDRSERMIFNNYQAMEIIRGMRNEPITVERILTLHRIVTDGTLDDPADSGRLRQDDGIEIRNVRDNTLLHVPPKYAQLMERLERLCAFANADETSTPFVHPVLRAILLHFMIGYDHPFADGNGRTARALFYWAMARSGYWLTEFLSISHFLRRAPSQYVRAYLHTETDGGDTTYFLLHQLDVIRRAVGALHAYLRRTMTDQQNTERLLAASPTVRTRLNHRQVALLTGALKHPGEQYRVEGHQRTHSIVYQTARTDLLELADLGLLTKGKAGRAFVFTAPEDLQQRIASLATAVSPGQHERVR
jgi:Fic family protein